MHILYIHQYFKTPKEGGGTRSYWIAKKLIDRGHQVTIITSANHQSKKIKYCIIEGIKVVYIRNYYDNKLSYLNRIVSFIKFTCKTLLISMTIKDINLVYATSTPLTVGIPALFLLRLRRLRFVFEVRDLWPDIPIEIGIIKNGIVKWILYNFEYRIYSKAAHIVALSPGMKNVIVDKGVLDEKISIVPNMCDLETFSPMEKTYKLHSLLDIPQDSIIAIHTGAMGMVNGLLKFALSVVINLPDIYFVFIGEGKEKADLEKLSSTVKNLYVLPQIPKLSLNEILNDADIFLMLVDPNFKIFETNSANKFFDYLAIGKPIVMNYQGWKYQIIKDRKLGYYIDQNNEEQFKNIFNQLNRVRLNKHISNGLAREVGNSLFNKNALTNQVATIIEDVQRVY